MEQVRGIPLWRRRRRRVIKDTLGDHMQGWVYNTVSMLNCATAKASGAIVSFFGLHVSGFYGDISLISLLFKLMLLDLVVGVWDAYRNHTWKPRIFMVRGMIKFPMYALYLFLVATMDHTAERIAQFSIPVVELFCLYLLSGEVYSISKHLKYLGFRVPEPLLWLSFGFKSKAERKLREASGIGENGLPQDDTQPIGEDKMDHHVPIEGAINFTIAELCHSQTAIEHGIDNVPTDPNVLANLETLAREALQKGRNHFGPIVVNSGYRGAALNKIIGGSPTSWHYKGCAADIEVPNYSLWEVFKWFNYNVSCVELIAEDLPNGWIHVAYSRDYSGPSITKYKLIGNPVRKASFEEIERIFKQQGLI